MGSYPGEIIVFGRPKLTMFIRDGLIHVVVYRTLGDPLRDSDGPYKNKPNCIYAKDNVFTSHGRMGCWYFETRQFGECVITISDSLGGNIVPGK